MRASPTDEATYLIKVKVDSKTGADNKLIVTSNTTYYKQDEKGAWKPGRHQHR